MADLARLYVKGLAEATAELRAMDSKLPKALAAANRGVAKMVAQSATAKASALGGVAAKAAPSIRSGGSTTGAYIKGGGDGFPFFFGAEFGSIRFKQFKPWRGSGSDTGYFMYPTLRERHDEIQRLYENELEWVLGEAGFIDV